MLLDLLADEKLASDLQLLFLDVTGQVDDLHAVLQGRRNAAERIRGRDEQDLRQIRFQIQVVILKGLVLLWIQELEQR